MFLNDDWLPVLITHSLLLGITWYSSSSTFFCFPKWQLSAWFPIFVFLMLNIIHPSAEHDGVTSVFVCNLGGGFNVFYYFRAPSWGRFPIWRAYCSDGLVQPPTSCILWWQGNYVVGSCHPASLTLKKHLRKMIGFELKDLGVEKWLFSTFSFPLPRSKLLDQFSWKSLVRA